MSGPRGPPPPPPPVSDDDIVLIDGPMLDDRQPKRPQPQRQQNQRSPMRVPQQPRSPAMMQQQPQRGPPQFSRNIQGMNGFGSQHISDIRPLPQLTEAYTRQKLTVYEVYTLRKAEPLPDYREFKEEKRDWRGNKRTIKPKPNWQRVIITKDAFDQEDIIKKIRNLDKHGRSVTTKKKDLAPHQHTQVTNLLDQKNGTEFDPSFGWTLVQLETKVVTNRITGLKETETMTLFLKRAPHQSVDTVLMYQKIEAAKMMANQPMKGGGGMGGPMGDKKMGGNVGLPKGAQVGKGFGLGGAGRGKKLNDPIIEIIDDRRRNSKSPRFSKSPIRGKFGGKKFHRDSDSSESSLSDSDSDLTYMSDSETTISSRSGRRRRESSYLRRDREPSRHHEKGYVMIEQQRRRPSNLVYAPDAPPRGGRAPSYERTSIGVDHKVADAFAAGVVAATKVAAADRDRRASSPLLSSARAIMYPRGTSHASFDDVGLRDLRIHDDLSLHDDISTRGFPDYREDMFRDDLRREDLLRREEMSRVQEAEDRLRRDSLSMSPRTRYIPAVNIRRGSISQLPLDADRPFNYSRNPMMPDFRRRDSMRDRMERMDYRGYH